MLLKTLICKVYVDIRHGSSVRGCQTTVGLSMNDDIFWQVLLSEIKSYLDTEKKTSTAITLQQSFFEVCSLGQNQSTNQRQTVLFLRTLHVLID